MAQLIDVSAIGDLLVGSFRYGATVEQLAAVMNYTDEETLAALDYIHDIMHPLEHWFEGGRVVYRLERRV